MTDRPKRKIRKMRRGDQFVLPEAGNLIIEVQGWVIEGNGSGPVAVELRVVLTGRQTDG